MKHEKTEKNGKLHIFVLFLQAALITLGVQVYEILRPKFPHIVEIMQQIPNTNIADIQKLDEKILVGTQSKGKIDKYKKDLFKKITAQVTQFSHILILIDYIKCPSYAEKMRERNSYHNMRSLG